MQLLRKYYQAAIVLVFVLLNVQTKAWALDERYAAIPLEGSKGQVKVDSSLTVQDDVFFDPSLKPFQTTYGIQNMVSLKFNEAIGVLLPSATYQVTVGFKVIGTRVDANGNQYIDSSISYAVQVSYSPTNQYNHRSMYNFNGVYRAKIRITSISINNGSVNINDVLPALVFENEMIVTREYAFSCTTNVINTVGKDTSFMSSKGELKVTWPKDKMCTEYDLEWTYIDSSALASFYNGANPDAKKIFLNNATRVSLAKEEYFIPMLYDNKGMLFYRVRPVQVKLNGQRMEATWSSASINGLGKYDYNGHERLLNWQATTSFAEDGKRKSVVQYFDGSLRSRQTVTKDNTTDTTIVAETFYDYQGRPSIQVLPAPSLSAMIKYTPNFNTGINNAEYDKTKYDGILNASNYCGVGATGMSPLSGASLYYSPFNQNKNIGFNRYIPNADSLPFTETRYTQDNTGRISSQGGVGKYHQIGTGHETKYYYGSADQQDLDALFGTEAGNYTHYFKNMVRDANGQYSVSYVDMHGRTIATALAGRPAGNILDTLESSRTIGMTKKMLDSANNIVKGTLIESSKSLVVTKSGAHKFVYALNPDSLKLATCNPADTVCYDCLYDLEITITDDCNNQSADSLPYTRKFSNFTVGSVDRLHNPINFSEQFTLYLNEGTYLVTKKLSVSKHGLDYYRDSIFAQYNVCKTVTDFINEQKQLLLAQLDCAPTCAKCSIDTLSNFSLYRPYYMLQMGISPTDSSVYRSQAQSSFDRQLEECQAICGNITLADSYRRQMLADVTPPFGQYANPELIDNNSIFAKSAEGYAVYSLIDPYYDLDGKEDKVFVLDVATKPGQLNEYDFTANFKNSWANPLLKKHPEYCKLELYETNPNFTSSHTWDEDFGKVNTYQEAYTKGYLNPLGYSNVIAQPSSLVKDPFFNSSVNPVYAATWRAVLNDSMRMTVKKSGGYIDIWSMSTFMAQCDTGNTACYNHYITNQYPFDIDTSCRGTLDMAWKYFRTLYLIKKSEIINKILGQSCNSGIKIDETKQKHILVFPDTKTLTDLVPSTVPMGQAKLVELINSSCEAYAEQWIKELGPCNYTTDDFNSLMPRLIKVCQEGGDVNHPFGASTVNPVSTNTYRNFYDVIKIYNDSLRTAASPRNIEAVQCNAYLISAPGAYENIQAYGNQELWSRPDSCLCTTISTLYEKYLSSSQGDNNFSAYIFRIGGTQMTNSALDSLRAMCKGELPCKQLVKPISIPPILQCGVKDVCASCGIVAQTYSRFQAAFPGVVPQADYSDSSQAVKNTLFEKYMNYNLGFGKQTSDYLDFIAQCGIAAGGISCDTLKKIIGDFESVRSDGVNFYGDEDVLTALPALVANGAIVPDSSIRYGGLRFYIENSIRPKAGRLCFQESYAIEYKFKFPQNTVNAGTDFYISSLGSACAAVFQMINSGPNPGLTLGSFKIEGSQNGCSDFGFYNRSSSADPCYNFPGTSSGQLMIAPGAGVLNTWMTLKIKTTTDRYYLYCNGNLVFEVARSVNTPLQWIGSQLSFNYAKDYSIDRITVYGDQDQVVYNEDFNNPQSPALITGGFCDGIDCQTSFASYFNQRRSTSYTFAQIDSIYMQNCGMHPDVCPVPLEDFCAQNLTYIKSYATPTGSSAPTDLVQTPDGGYIVSGGTSNYGVGGTDVYVTKFTKRGMVEWSKSFGKAYDDYLWRIRSTADSGFIAVGTINAVGLSYGQIWVLKLDKFGNQQWSKSIGKAGGGGTGDVGVNVIQLSDGTYMVNGYYQFVAGSVDWVVCKLSASGAMIWNKRYGTSGSDQPAGMVEDGDSLLLSSLYQGATLYDGLVLKIGKQDGGIGWARSYEIDGRSNWFYDIFKTTAGYTLYAYSGDDYAGANVYGNMIRIDSVGIPYQAIKVGRANSSYTNNGAIYIKPTRDEGFVITQSPSVNSDIYVQKVDSAGNVSWSNRIKMAGIQDPRSIVQNMDGSYMIAGLSNEKSLLVKTNLLGQTLCNDSALTITNTNPSIFSAPFTFSVNTTVALDVLNVENTGVNFYFKDSTLCMHDPCAQVSGPMLCGKSVPIFSPVMLQQYSPCDDSTNFAATTGTLRYQAYSDSLYTSFNDKYLAKCLNAYKIESFTVTQAVSEFHYTLYYYDQAGNLVRTVPPEGIDLTVWSRPAYFDSVKTARAGNLVYKPKHALLTNYRYNTLNQVVTQKTPDAGQSNFWYDRLGRLVISQNAKQKAATGASSNKQYSYTTYDYLGRINQVGQVTDTTSTGSMTNSFSRNTMAMDNWLLALTAKKEQVTRTFYDNVYSVTDVIPLNAKNLRNRLSYSSYTVDNSPTVFNHATFYSYDIHGNVDTLVQDYGSSLMGTSANVMNANSNRWHRIVYKYDLISGKVNHVSYNPRFYNVVTKAWVNPPASFYHRYSYDAENRITRVETSKDSANWETDARYEYYKHGPLARTILGDQLVQGLDYVYTIQGWLKGMNSTTTDASFDVGEDGKINGQNKYIARDVVGYNLNYYAGDYSAIFGNSPFPEPGPQLNSLGVYRPLYNGNISSMAVSIKQFNQPYLYNYKYDQLNRLRAMDTYTGLNTASNTWNTLSFTSAFNERVNYDGNGNIKKYTRYFDVISTPMDILTYNYIPGTNKLSHVSDVAQGWVNNNRKIKNQLSGNYAYDEIGNLVKDSTEKIPLNGITWNAYGKITEINHSASGVLFNAKRISYTYDAGGNRVGKKVTKFGTAVVDYTYYVRDASGNILATYTSSKDSASSLVLFDLINSENHIYGSSRLGTYNRGDLAENNSTRGSGATYYSSRGRRFYEISNHLGNVLTSISDRKFGHNNGSGVVDYYNTDVVSATDYYPFGMVSRTANVSISGLNYRYGFNGKENDNDVKGEGNQQDYGMRIYDPRLGRFLSVDPITAQYPELTPYQFASNTPVQAIDLDGLEAGNPPSFELPSTYPWEAGYILKHPRPVECISEPKKFSNKITKADWEAKERINRGTFKVATTIATLIPIGRGVQVGGTAIKLVVNYLGRKSIDASIDAFAQLATNDFDVKKIDWIDVGTNYLPSVGGKWRDVITSAYKNTIEAAADYTTQKGGGLRTVFDGSKDLTNAGLEALVGTVVDKVYGAGNEIMRKQFEKVGLDKKTIESRLFSIVEKERDAIKEVIKNELQQTSGVNK